jgi:hypothetical protein
MIKNDQFLLNYGPKHDISKRHLNRRVLTLFLRFFGLDNKSKNLF